MPDDTPKVALITGPTSGIGEAFAHKLAAQSYSLILVARHPGKLDRLSASLRDKYRVDINPVVADLSVEEQVTKVEQVIAALPRLDLLINNAGFGVGGFFIEVPFQKQMDMINVHLGSTIRFSRAAIPVMANQNSPAAIINVSSFIAFMDLPGSVMYTTTKSAVVKFSKTLQHEVKGYGIKIQALCPVFTPTSFHKNINKDLEFMKNVPDFFWTSREDVVLSSLKALQSGNVICIPGNLNKVIYWFQNQPVLGSIIHRMAMVLNKRSKVPSPDSLKSESYPQGQSLSHKEIGKALGS